VAPVGAPLSWRRKSCRPLLPVLYLPAPGWLTWRVDVIGYIPSPPSNGITVGSFELHFYGLLIAIAVLVAAWLARRRWVKLGGFAGTIVPIAFWAVVGGLIGARLYSVATSWQQDTGGDPVQIFEIWNGGLGIWGGVGGGVLGGWLAARRMRLPLPPLLDVVAPAIPLGQAIGRWGNYFNQELFGLPSKLPWAVRITDQAQLGNIYPPKYRPPMVDGLYLPGTFQPTFLYECIWDLITVGLLLLIERQVKLRRGYLFAAYAAIYTFGRFFTEYLRIDPSHRYLGLRLNDWTSIGVFVCASAILLIKGRPKPGDELVGEPLPAPVLVAENARAEQAARRAGRGHEAETDEAKEPLAVVGAAAEGDAGATAPGKAVGPEPGTTGPEKAVDAAAGGAEEPVARREHAAEASHEASGKQEEGPRAEEAPVANPAAGGAPAPATPSSPADGENT
jgi:prolipoprotein diacylglyceryl transferase